MADVLGAGGGGGGGAGADVMEARHSFSSSWPGSASSELEGVLGSSSTQRGGLSWGMLLSGEAEEEESGLAGIEETPPLGSCGRLRPASSEMSRVMAVAPRPRVGGRELRLVDLWGGWSWCLGPCF
jgi:hypothetical protein